MNCNIKTFKINITPPIGNVLCGGLHGPSKYKETDLHFRGVILTFDEKPIVIGALDFCLLDNESHAQMTKTIADAAGTDLEKVSVHTVHQHDVPLVDEWTHKLLDKYDVHLSDWNYWEEVLKNTDQAIRKLSSEAGTEITHYNISKSKVFQFASNRRIKTKNGMQWRATKCQDKKLKSYATGKIDPYLRQCSFYDTNQELIVSLNFYATHPQVANNRDAISDDAPGYALRQMESAFPKAFHVYFNGCGADLGNAKYASPDREEDIQVFGTKLFHAMKRCQQEIKLKPLDKIEWISHSFPVPIKEVKKTKEELEAIITSKDCSSVEKYISGLNLNVLEKGIKEYPFKVSSLKLPDSRMMFLPAEMFIEYQIYCQSIMKDEELLVAAYGDGFLAYIPQDEDFEWGGYELNEDWNWVKPGIEKLLKEELTKFCKQ
ncbi:MAG: hypothetical protein COA79_07840 [Planctomycetota bacterium]|nr:MAG: hypothetical protein COA79_07840 [Planctomycetota bacterium]